MYDYVKTMLNDAPSSMDGKAATPAAAHLFKVNMEIPKLLGKEKKDLFVHLVMQGLYLSQHGWPGIRTAFSFLCSHLMSLDSIFMTYFMHVPGTGKRQYQQHAIVD